MSLSLCVCACVRACVRALDNIKSIKKNKEKYGKIEIFFFVAGFAYWPDISACS